LEPVTHRGEVVAAGHSVLRVAPMMG